MSAISSNDPLGFNSAKTPPNRQEERPRVAARSETIAAPVQTAPAQSAPQPVRDVQTEPRAEEFQAALSSLEQAVRAKAPNELQFDVDKDTGRTIVRIVDSNTGETIRQIPPRELVEIAKSIDQMQGLLLRQEA